MKPSQLSTAIKTCVLADQPLLIEGPPGVGKSRIVGQAVNDMGRVLLDERVSDRDPVEICGLYQVVEGKTIRSRPEFMPEDDGKAYVLFLDEISTAVPLTQAVCLQLVLDRRVGPHKLPKNCAVIAAANRLADGALVQRMSSAFRDRFTKVELETDLEDWSNWAAVVGIDPSVMGFLRERTELLHKFDKNQAAWPSPRGWEFVSKIIQMSPPKSVERELIEGTVGAGAAVEYIAFLERYRDLPPIDDILADPKNVMVPKDPSLLYALASGLSYRAEPKILQSIVDYTERVPTEYRILTMTFAIQRYAAMRNDELKRCPTFTKWAVRYQDFYKDWN